jgi:hypothetical protein
MILSPVPPAFGPSVNAPITVRLIGSLDRTLVESFTDCCSGLMVVGRQTLFVSLRDVLTMRDENLTRFIATLEAYRVAGHDVRIDGGPVWTKLLREAGLVFEPVVEGDEKATRRQVIIAHSLVNGRSHSGRTARPATSSTSG